MDRHIQVKYLGTHLNSNLLFKSQIKIKCKAVMINIIRVNSILKYLIKDTCHTFILSLATAHLDYKNSLIIGLSKKSINLMQYEENTAAEVILKRHTKGSATQCLMEIYWLYIQQRIYCKICTIVFKALQKKPKVSARPNTY